MTEPVDSGPDMQAAELALGVLDGEERTVALRRMLAEPAFAAEVAWWRDQLAALAADVPAVAPDADLFSRIERRLSPSPVAPARRSWPWRAIAGVTSLAAAASIALLFTRPEPAPRIVVRQPVALLAGVIAPTGVGEPISAVFDPGTNVLLIGGNRLVDAATDPELWVIGQDGVPHSLGLLRGGGTSRVAVSPANRARIDAGAVLAISIEPAGGSPGPSPTGPVVAKGSLSLT